MTDPRQTAEEIWSQISDWYQRDGFTDACLQLQDEHGIDVIALLTCCWAAAERGIGALDLYPACRTASTDWCRDVVAPLRRVRRSLMPGRDDATTRTRNSVAAAELDAELAQVQRLSSLVEGYPATEPPAIALGHQLAAIASHVPDRRTDAIQQLATIASAIAGPGTDHRAAISAAATALDPATTSDASTATAVRIACIQVDSPTSEPLTDRIERVTDLIAATAATERAEVILLPELWTTGFFHFDRYDAEAQPIDGSIVQRLSEVARDSSVWLFGGSFVEQGPDGRRHNTSVVFGPDGKLAGRYRKLHLFGYESAEARSLSPGAEPVVIPTPFGRVGLATCYDLRFPEQFRRMVDAGAEAFVIVSAWPEARRDHWLLLLRARAVENLAPVIACNAAGTHGGTELAGTSCVISPWGDVVEHCDGNPTTLLATLDPSGTARVRSEFPSLTDRRAVPPALVFQPDARV